MNHCCALPLFLSLILVPPLGSDAGSEQTVGEMVYDSIRLPEDSAEKLGRIKPVIFEEEQSDGIQEWNHSLDELFDDPIRYSSDCYFDLILPRCVDYFSGSSSGGSHSGCSVAFRTNHEEHSEVVEVEGPGLWTEESVGGEVDLFGHLDWWRYKDELRTGISEGLAKAGLDGQARQTAIHSAFDRARRMAPHELFQLAVGFSEEKLLEANDPEDAAFLALLYLARIDGLFSGWVTNTSLVPSRRRAEREALYVIPYKRVRIENGDAAGYFFIAFDTKTGALLWSGTLRHPTTLPAAQDRAWVRTYLQHLVEYDRN